MEILIIVFAILFLYWGIIVISGGIYALAQWIMEK